jgi:hypothetical protein
MFRMNNLSIGGVRIPDSKLAQAATELVRDTESDLLFHHSTRVYYFGALAGQRQNLNHDLGTGLQVSGDISEPDQLIRNPPANLVSGAVVTVVKPAQQ